MADRVAFCEDAMLTPEMQTKLRTLIARHTAAQVELSWKGSQPPDDATVIELDAEIAALRLERFIDSLGGAPAAVDDKVAKALERMSDVRSDVAPPPPKESTIKEQLKGMQVGDSFTVPYTRNPVTGNLARATGWKFRQQIEGDLLRIWRIE